ncbi:hypothetical protein OAK17_01990 [Alphaproteobacteria bacterium]|nr:hypothetical protein [Alphaproteobacteria bacterium]
MNIEINQIESLVAPIIASFGYRLVKLNYVKNIKNEKLQIMIEYIEAYEMNLLNDGGITAEDCAALSRKLSLNIDESKFFSDFLELEISSPGLDRFLISIEDFRRFKQFEMSIELKKVKNGTKKFIGMIGNIKSRNIFFESNLGNFDLDINEIKAAKLNITEDLISKSSIRTLRSLTN